jgi:hypothetical protein
MSEFMSERAGADRFRRGQNGIQYTAEVCIDRLVPDRHSNAAREMGRSPETLCSGDLCHIAPMSVVRTSSATQDSQNAPWLIQGLP